jgi:UDP:flavonoid glycosyltransferase YjiC (YdhE family)
VRILFAFIGGPGHLDPLVPLGEAAAAAGHEVAYAGRPSALEPLAARGVTVFATEPPRTAPRRRKPLLPVDVERERRDFRHGFARRLAREQAEAIGGVCAEWRPDVLVCDETDLGAMVAAERLGLPHAAVIVVAARSFSTPDLVAEELDAVRAEHGLLPDPEVGMIARHLLLVPFPPRYRDPVSPLPASTAAFRPSDPRPAEPADPPLVYFSLGTEFNVECGDLFSRVLAGLRELPVQVVATVGRDIDPAELGPQPTHVRVERYVSQAELLPRASLAVSHGGSGSVLGALAHGVPLVLLPMGADQPYNASRCEALGVARSLDVIEATPADVRDAAAEVLEEPSYRAAAERLRDEFAALPGPEHAVALIEQLV